MLLSRARLEQRALQDRSSTTIGEGEKERHEDDYQSRLSKTLAIG